jgi:hypothetical protein
MIDIHNDLNFFLIFFFYLGIVFKVYESLITDILHLPRIIVYNDSLCLKIILFINIRYYFIKDSYITFSDSKHLKKATGTFMGKESTFPLFLLDEYNEQLSGIVKFINNAIEQNFHKAKNETIS